MGWLGDIQKRRRLRKAIAEAIVLEALRGHDFPDDELARLTVGGPERPLGDVFDGEYFLMDRFCRTRYVFYLACLISECGKCLAERE